jgi:hypothetical protein
LSFCTRIHRETSGVCRPVLALTSQNKYLSRNPLHFFIFSEPGTGRCIHMPPGRVLLDNSEPFGFVSDLCRNPGIPSRCERPTPGCPGTGSGRRTMAKAARTLSLHAACTHSLSVGVFSDGELSRQRSRVRVPSSSPLFIPKQLVHFWKIGAIRKKIQIERPAATGVVFCSGRIISTTCSAPAASCC